MPPYLYWTKEKVIKEIRERKERGEALSYADLARRLQRYWTPQQIVSQIKTACKAGKNMRLSHAQRWNSKLVAAAWRHFGSWYEALRRAGIDPESLRDHRQRTSGPRGDSRRRQPAHWTEQRILETLRDLNRQGQDLRHATMQKRNVSLFHAAKAFFGSWVNAVLQAGIDYEQVVRKQLGRRRAPADSDASSSSA